MDHPIVPAEGVILVRPVRPGAANGHVIGSVVSVGEGVSLPWGQRFTRALYRYDEAVGVTAGWVEYQLVRLPSVIGWMRHE